MSMPQIPPHELAAPIPEAATPEQRVRLWMDLYDACEQLLLAGLRRQIGPDGDLRAAYRQWYAQQMEEHDRTIQHLVDELNRRGGGHAL
jgi:hypothetical protein